VAEEYASMDPAENERGWHGGVAHVDDIEEIIQARILTSPLQPCLCVCEATLDPKYLRDQQCDLDHRVEMHDGRKHLGTDARCCILYCRPLEIPPREDTL